jgi:hypothetical protein
MTVTTGNDGRIGLIFERQWLHAAGLIVLLAACHWAAQAGAVREGGLWGLTSLAWYWIAILTAVLHQVYVWLCWRIELHGKGLTRRLGSAAFPAFAFGFAAIGIARVITVFLLAFADRDSVAADPVALKIAAVVALLPALYLFYSVKRYFTFRRAFGADHFDPEFRRMPFVRAGIFRFTSNAMYVFGFLLLWVPALWWASAAALVVALFNHLYIWVHYFATERPDIERIYGKQEP